MGLEERLGQIRLTEKQFRTLAKNLNRRYAEGKVQGGSYTAKDVKNLFRGTNIGKELGIKAIREEIEKVARAKNGTLGIKMKMSAAILGFCILTFGAGVTMFYPEKLIRENSSQSSPSITSQNEIQRYSGAVVFAYEDSPLNKSTILKRFNELKEGSKFDYGINDWTKKEAEKFGKKIDISLGLLPVQIKIPDSFILNGKYPIDLNAFSEYLRENYAGLNDYSFTSIITNSAPRKGQPLGYASPKSKSFIIVNNYQTNNQIFEHELLHLLGAKDKDNQRYNYLGSNDIMQSPYFIDDYIGQERLQGYFLREKDFISEETAKEVGWTQ
jgi:hypothetical protein